MVSSISSSNLLALQKATDSAAQSGASSLSSASGTSSSASSGGAFASMATNENNFLKLLTTQLQHQDPSSPMNSENMASQIAQFSSVEQAVQTNTNLQSLISLNESSQLTQNKNLVGQTATFSSGTLPLQSSSASLSYSAGSGQTVGISVANASGTIVRHDIVSANGGQNNWTWNGKDDQGNQLSDGAYSVSVKEVDSAGNTSDVPFTVSGKVTGIQKGTSGVNLLMGSAQVPLSSVQSTS